VNIKNQGKNPLVDIVGQALEGKKWKPSRLAQESGVAQPVISGFLRGAANLGVTNTYKILKTLDLLKNGISCESTHYPPEIQKECEKVAKILTSDYDHIKDELIYYLNKLTTDCEMADRNAKRLRRLEEQNKEMRQELRELRKRERLGYSPVREGPARRGAKKEG